MIVARRTPGKPEAGARIQDKGQRAEGVYLKMDSPEGDYARRKSRYFPTIYIYIYMCVYVCRQPKNLKASSVKRTSQRWGTGTGTAQPPSPDLPQQNDTWSAWVIVICRFQQMEAAVEFSENAIGFLEKSICNKQYI